MELLRRADYSHRQLSSRKSGEQYSRSALLSDALAAGDVTIRHEILAPGHRASAPHHHQETDEILIVTKGQATVYEGGESFVLHAGDAVNFRAGSDIAHWVANESDEALEFITVTKKLAAPDVIFAG